MDRDFLFIDKNGEKATFFFLYSAQSTGRN
jgi:hypothetical protein